ncbi:hypothetical protein ACC785_38980, partial [Rhizobium ruizarguesonis]
MTKTATIAAAPLNSALHLAVLSGIGVTLLLLFGFVVAFLGYRHEPGAAVLFVAALCFLAGVSRPLPAGH